MVRRRKLPRVFFGWWTVIGGGILALWGIGYYMYGFSALFKPIASELGLNRAETSVAASIGRLEGGIESPLTGWITDRYGPKWIILGGVFFIGLSLTLMNYVNSLWAFYVVWGVILGTGINMAITVPMQTAITNWFVKKRGRAMSTHFVIGGASGTLVGPLIAWLITTRGWRTACSIGGIVMWLVGLPIVWFFVKRHRPEYYGLLPDGATVRGKPIEAGQMLERGVEYAAEAKEVEFTLRQAMRTRAYWFLILAQAGHVLAMPAITVHGIPFLTDTGIDLVRAAGILAIMSIVSIPTRFISGFIADRISKDHLRFLMGGIYLLEATGFTVFLIKQTIPMIFVWFILYGIGFGAGLTLTIYIRSRYFGRKAFGSIHGSSMMIITPLSMFGPIYLGLVHDTSGTYISAFILVAAALAFGAAVMFFITPPGPPPYVTDVRGIM